VIDRVQPKPASRLRRAGRESDSEGRIPVVDDVVEGGEG